MGAANLLNAYSLDGEPTLRTAPRTHWLPLFALYAALVAAQPAHASDEPEDVLKPPPFDQFLVLPLRVHILKATDLNEVDCHLRDDDITRILGKVNGIWNKAGLHWALETVIREPAANQGKFRLIRDLDGAKNLPMYRMLVPESNRSSEGLHVYYLHKFPVNGVWFGDVAVVQETASLREVEGGLDEPLPRVTAHELGHALGLPHRQARTNLLASGTTGTRLNAREVEIVRASAKEVKGVRTVTELKVAAARAETADDLSEARKLWGWLGEIPGGGDEVRLKVEKLRVGPKTQ